MASAVVSDNFENGTGGVPQLGGADRQNQWCKAWVLLDNPNGTAIVDSYNVSSVTEVSTGVVNVNFATPLTNANYATVATGSSHSGAAQNYAIGVSAGKTNTYFQMHREGSTGTASELHDASAAVFSN